MDKIVPTFFIMTFLKSQKIPVAITSNEWRKLFQEKQLAKEKLEQEKLERKHVREEKQKEKEREKEDRQKQRAAKKK